VLMLLVAVVGAWLYRRRTLERARWFQRTATAAIALPFIAATCGWVLTEVGRQPWIVQGFMRTSEAVTDAQGIWFVFAAAILLYAALGTAAVLVLRILSRRWREEGDEAAEADIPYAPQGVAS